jgi:hypothetical protein
MASNTKKASLILDNMVWQKIWPNHNWNKMPWAQASGPRKQSCNDFHLTISISN